MSQQSQFEEEGRHYQSGYSSYPDEEFPQNSHLHEGLGQKVYHTEPAGRSLSAGQRLALALVSVCVLIPLVAIILGNTSSDSVSSLLLVAEQLIALVVICITIMIVNIAANWRR